MEYRKSSVSDSPKQPSSFSPFFHKWHWTTAGTFLVGREDRESIVADPLQGLQQSLFQSSDLRPITPALTPQFPATPQMQAPWATFSCTKSLSPCKPFINSIAALFSTSLWDLFLHRCHSGQVTCHSHGLASFLSWPTLHSAWCQPPAGQHFQLPNLLLLLHPHLPPPS